jgi:hypothetical protein
MTGSVRSDFFVRMVLAAGHLGNGGIDEACDAARQALDLGTALRSARCTEYVWAFRQQLADFDRLPRSVISASVGVFLGQIGAEGRRGPSGGGHVVTATLSHTPTSSVPVKPTTMVTLVTS